MPGGNEGNDIFIADKDRQVFLKALGKRDIFVVLFCDNISNLPGTDGQAMLCSYFSGPDLPESVLRLGCRMNDQCSTVGAGRLPKFSALARLNSLSVHRPGRSAVCEKGRTDLSCRLHDGRSISASRSMPEAFSLICRS